MMGYNYQRSCLQRLRVLLNVFLSLLVHRLLKGRVPTGVFLGSIQRAWVFEYVETVMELVKQGKHAPCGAPAIYWDYDDWVV